MFVRRQLQLPDYDYSFDYTMFTDGDNDYNYTGFSYNCYEKGSRVQQTTVIGYGTTK